MYTPTNAYQRKFSSGLIVSLLAISTLVILGSFAVPAHAANAQFSASLTYPYVVVGTTGAVRNVMISNPAGNSGITEVDLSISTSAAAAVTAAAAADGFITTVGNIGGSGPWTIVYTSTTSGNVILPQGAAGHLRFTFNSEASEDTTGTADSYTLTLLVNYKDGSTQTGTVTLMEGRATAVASSTTASSQTVGTSVAFSAAVSPADSGIPLTWTSTPSVSTVTNAGFSASFAPSSGATDSTGHVTTSYVSTESGAYTATAILATAYGSDAGGLLPASASSSVTLTPSSPTQVKVLLAAYDVTGVSTDIVSAVGATGIGMTLADQYGNPVTTSASGSVTFTALAGTVPSGSFTVTSGVCACGAATYAPTKSGSDLNYGSFDLISATFVVSTGPLQGTYTGSSHQLTIGYLSTTNVATSTPSYTIYTAPYAAPGNVQAGTPVNVALTLAGPQKGIPVNFSLIADPVTGYTGTFSNGLSWMVVTTGTTGIATANFTADTLLGDDATVQAIVSEPTTASPSNTVSSLHTISFVTGVAPPAGLLVQLYKSTGPLAGLTTYTSPGAHLYVDVKLQDAYSNPVSWNHAFALGITLSASTGSGLSITQIAITSGQGDTTGSGYTVQYTAPSTLGTATVTATTTQPGVATGQGTMHVVSLSPSVFITAPNNPSSLSTNSQTVKGYAVPSLAAASGTAVVTFQYSLNGAANVTTGVTGTNSSGASFFSFPVTFINGTNTLKVFATDSNSLVGVSTGTFVVTHAPPVGFAGSQVVQGTPTKVTIGGYTGINATYKNTWTSAENEIVFAVWKNSAGQTVAVSTGGLNLAAGATGTAFLPLSAPLASGSYTVSVFVITVGNAPDSSATSINVSV